jgi:hypothetical protein
MDRHQQIAQALSETAMNIRLNSIESSQRQMQIQNMNRMQTPQFYTRPIYTQTPSDYNADNVALNQRRKIVITPPGSRLSAL